MSTSSFEIRSRLKTLLNRVAGAAPDEMASVGKELTEIYDAVTAGRFGVATRESADAFNQRRFEDHSRANAELSDLRWSIHHSDEWFSAALAFVDDWLAFSGGDYAGEDWDWPARAGELIAALDRQPLG